MSIGWVMFWKALVLGIGAVFAEKYRRYRLVQKVKGLPLKDRGDGVYVVDDRLGRAELFLKDLRDWAIWTVWAWWAVLAVLIIVL